LFELSQGEHASLFGGPTARANLEAQLRLLAEDFHRFDQLGESTSATANRSLSLRPLDFDYDFQVPLFDNPVDTLLAMISQQPFDLAQADFMLGSDLSLNYALPLAALSAALPPLAAVFSAIDARLDLKAGLAAQMALSLGLTSTLPTLGAFAQGVVNGSISGEGFSTSLAGLDPITGQPIGLYLAQTSDRPLFRLSPSINVGLGIGRFGVAASAYGQVDGLIDVSFRTADSAGRLYLAESLGRLADVPGLDAQASLFGEVGLRLDSIFGRSNPNYKYPIVQGLDLLTSPMLA
jgi:hypothetical protein